jgi:hypothetical protein
MILLYHENTQQVAISEKSIPGHGVIPEHSYLHEGKLLAVDGGGDPIIAASDAEDILKIAGYRMATPDEQSSYVASRQKQSAIREKAAAKAASEAPKEVGG